MNLLVPSGACLPPIKPTWSGCISDPIRGCSLVASTLAYIFMSLFTREMGLKFAGSEGFFPGFGIATTKDSKDSLGKDPALAAWLATVLRRGDRISEYVLKYSLV